MKKGKNKKDKFFAKKNGSLLMLAGTLFLALTFLNTGGDLPILELGFHGSRSLPWVIQ